MRAPRFALLLSFGLLAFTAVRMPLDKRTKKELPAREDSVSRP